MMHMCQVDSSGSLQIELFTAFAIWYRFDDKQANSSLRLHRDDSDIQVTVNLKLSLCQQAQQAGSRCAVSFEGDHRLTSAQSQGGLPHYERTVVNIPAGWALLHHGGHPGPHEVTPITGGERWSIILWYKKKRQGTSTRDRSADGPSALIQQQRDTARAQKPGQLR